VEQFAGEERSATATAVAFRDPAQCHRAIDTHAMLPFALEIGAAIKAE